MIEKLSITWALKFVINLWRKYYVDVHMTVFWMGMGASLYAFFPALYAAACNTLYNDIEICSALPPEAEDAVQTLTANWLMYIELCRFFPCILSVTFLSKYGDEHGVKIPLLLAIGSQAIQAYFMLVGITVQGWGLAILLISTFVTSLGGTTTLFLTCQFAEAGRNTVNPDDLVYRYTILAASWTMGSFIAGYIVAELFAVTTYANVILIGQALMTVTFLSTVCCYGHPEKPAERPEMKKTDSNIKLEKSDLISTKKTGFIKRLVEIYKDAWLTLIRPRPGNRRAYVIIIMTVCLIYATTDIGLDSILTLYVYRSPLSWTPEAYSRFSALLLITQMAGSVISAYIFKHLKFSDTIVVLISLFSSALKMTLISLATESWYLYVSLAVGTISTVGFSGLRSFIALLGSQEEVGSLLGLQMLVSSWSLIIGAAVFNNMYTATLSFYPGFSFAFTAVLLGLCFLAILFIHIDYKKEMKKANSATEITRL